jgi:hypothetical protein
MLVDADMHADQEADRIIEFRASQRAKDIQERVERSRSKPYRLPAA